MVKKGILNQLIQNHDLTSLEQNLVYSYLTNNKLNFNDNQILIDYFKGFQQNPQLYFDTSLLDISSIKELENYLELIIPVEDRKFNGAFFTP
ncbi:MAG: DNA methyltransferase, partial [Bacteroidota bacterium]